MSEQTLDPNRLVEAYSLTSGRKATIPAAWIGDPVLGRDWAKTPAQAEYDGDLPPRPTNDSTVPEIDDYADAAGIELHSSDLKDEKLAAIDAVFASHGDAQTVQVGMVPVDVPEPPPGAPLGDPQPPPDPAADPNAAPGPATGDPTDDTGNPAGDDDTTQE